MSPSYDYDAVLTEAGDFTVKYENTEVIGKYTASPGNFFNGYKKERLRHPEGTGEGKPVPGILTIFPSPVSNTFPIPMENWIRATVTSCTVQRWKEQNLEKSVLWGSE